MIAKLQIETSWKDRSVLKHAFYTPPVKVATITEDISSGILQLVLMNVSPGILDGDDYRLEIKAGEKSSLHLHTQSYQRLFTMRTSAFQLMNVHLEKNSPFFFYHIQQCRIKNPILKQRIIFSYRQVVNCYGVKF